MSMVIALLHFAGYFSRLLHLPRFISRLLRGARTYGVWCLIRALLKPKIFCYLVLLLSAVIELIRTLANNE